MSQTTSFLRHLQPLFQAARGLLPRITDTAFLRPEFVTMEPYMDILPNRRPLPRTARAYRIQSLMQMSIDA